jgi:hypothetical protein
LCSTSSNSGQTETEPGNRVSLNLHIFVPSKRRQTALSLFGRSTERLKPAIRVENKSMPGMTGCQPSLLWSFLRANTD